MAANVTVPRPSSCRLSVAGITNVGRVRKRNEDTFIIMDLDAHARAHQIDRQLDDGRGVLLVVADGMGGAKGGDIASMMASETVADTVEEKKSCADKVLATALEHAHEAVRLAAGALELQGMGTTLTVAHVCGEVARIAHVGDSRAYLARDGELLQLTRDDTVVQAAIDAGAISPEQAKTSPMRHILSEVVGAQDTIRPALGHVQLVAGDRLLLCTDGLNEIDEDEILHILEESETCAGAAERLVQSANERGGRDNVTVVVAMVDEAGSGMRRAASTSAA